MVIEYLYLQVVDVRRLPIASITGYYYIVLFTSHTKKYGKELFCRFLPNQRFGYEKNKRQRSVDVTLNLQVKINGYMKLKIRLIFNRFSPINCYFSVSLINHKLIQRLSLFLNKLNVFKF